MIISDILVRGENDDHHYTPTASFSNTPISGYDLDIWDLGHPLPRKSVQELYHRHDRDSLECFQAQEMTVSGDDNIGPGPECAGQENAVGRVLRHGVTDIQKTGPQLGLYRDHGCRGFSGSFHNDLFFTEADAPYKF